MLPDFSPKKSGRLEEPQWPARFKPLGYYGGGERARVNTLLNTKANVALDVEPENDDHASTPYMQGFDDVQVIDEPMRFHDNRADHALAAPMESDVIDADNADFEDLTAQQEFADQMESAAAASDAAQKILDKVDGAIDALGSQILANLNDGVVNMFSAIARKSMQEEGLQALRDAISKMVPKATDVTVTIVGPAALLEQIKTLINMGDAPQCNAEFVEDKDSIDVIAHYEKTSLTTRFAELEQILAGAAR